ncbi:MAG: helical backbone metal receptor [Bacteroidia bacterium]
MTSSTDQLGRTLQFESVPIRIVSLVPSQTELLFDLGLQERVVGITKFCIHPEQWYRSKQRIGGTKQLDIQKIRELNPDLIIGNKEENEMEQIQLLMKDYPVWMSDIADLNDAINMIKSIGDLVQKNEMAENIISQISRNFELLLGKITKNQTRVAYLIWKKPWMAAGNKTFIHSMLKFCGFENVFQNKARYPETNPEELNEMKPEVVLLSSEPYPFNENDANELLDSIQESKILVVDGEAFSWYGSRLIHSPEYFRKLLLRIDSPS